MASIPACILTVDVEDWFHILDTSAAPPASEWNSLPSRIEYGLRHLLQVCDEKNVHVTCFFLGWVAERFPDLVRETAAAGHEIASHGYLHRLVYRMTEEEFYQDALRSRKLLEDLTGETVAGYRAAGFSATRATPWFVDALLRAGYIYDSSVFPAHRGHGGLSTDRLGPHLWEGVEGRIQEFPVSVLRFLGSRICLFGGGYLRLTPYALIRRAATRLLHEGRPVIFYVHPRELDVQHPRLPLSPLRRFKAYVNLRTAEPKLRALLNDFSFVTCRQLLAAAKLPES